MRERFHQRTRVRLPSPTSPSSFFLFLPFSLLFVVLPLQDSKWEMCLSSFNPVTEADMSQVLIEAGCEKDPMNKARICLLLSRSQSYPNSIFNDEKWLLEAHQQLQRCQLGRSDGRTSRGRRTASQYLILKACYAIRVRSAVLGTHRAYVPPDLSTEITQIHQSDLEEDTNYSWWLDVDTKRTLANIFLATVDLAPIIDPLCHVLNQRKPNPVGTRDVRRRSILSELEECEGKLVAWFKRHETLMSFEEGPASRSNDAFLSLFSSRAYLRLAYE